MFDALQGYLGSYYVNEGYGELSIPLLSNMPGVQNLEATAAARVFKYSTFGSDYTYKFGGRYTPVRDVTVRGTYSTAFRAPSISDLFFGQSDNFPNVSDPCSTTGGATPPPSCTGVVNADDQTQHRSRIGGNPEDAFNFDFNTGPTSYDRRHVLVGTWTYQMPSLRDRHHAVGLVLGNWELSGKVRLIRSPVLISVRAAAATASGVSRFATPRSSSRPQSAALISAIAFTSLLIAESPRCGYAECAALPFV